MENRIFRTLGLMSGTSLDGIDISLMDTDGYAYVKPIAGQMHPYDAAFRDKLRSCLGKKEGIASPDIKQIERELTLLHADVVNRFLAEKNIDKKTIDLIGFHGQTIWHHPAQHQTIQLGDGPLLAKETGIQVVYDFRKADVLAGGEGAPFAPVYHVALAAKLEKPMALINIGGVSNITWIPSDKFEECIAFDLGPGNALIDDCVRQEFGLAFDEKGRIAASGTPDEVLLRKFMDLPYFSRIPPKSLDRNEFQQFDGAGLEKANRVATMTKMTVLAIKSGIQLLSDNFGPVKYLVIAGGGRHNDTLMAWIAQETGLPIHSADSLGWNGDTLEAELFAYLAVRAVLGLPLSMPLTTSVPRPISGGKTSFP